MMPFWDKLQDEYMALNKKERKLNIRRPKLYSSFNHPNTIAVYEDIMINIHGKESKEKFMDGTTTKYADCNYPGFRRFKKDSFL